MVKLEIIENKIEELEVFFRMVESNPQNIDNSSSGSGIKYGFLE